MEPALLALLAAAVVVLGLAASLVWALARSRAGQHRLERDLADTRAEISLLQGRLDELEHRSGPAPDAGAERPDYVITTLPDHPASALEGRPPTGESGPSRREFASMALTESAVKVTALAHGVRRALSPQSRNRIRFEMRREVKRSRRQRRRTARHAKRHGEPDPVLSHAFAHQVDEAA